MKKPDYARQTAEPEVLLNGKLVAEWLDAAEAEARKEGCIAVRRSVHINGEALLVEGWVEHPTDIPLPRWFEVAK